jgi:hypothetical protein
MTVRPVIIFISHSYFVPFTEVCLVPAPSHQHETENIIPYSCSNSTVGLVREALVFMNQVVVGGTFGMYFLTLTEHLII